jgi:dipeptidyl aminopeptidase/acylaminoacyl peptidase
MPVRAGNNMPMEPRTMLATGSLLASFLASQAAPIPDNLVVEGVPPQTAELQQAVGRYLEFRTATFQNWHPQRREQLVITRFADTPQLHLVRTPGGARRQLTFLPEPVRGAAFQPKTGAFAVFSQDTGGGEFFQLYRLDLADGAISLLTDGRSRNTGVRWARSGNHLAYTSTRRSGKDNDVWLMNPEQPASANLILEVTGGGWSVLDWSHDESKLLLMEYISINKSHLHLLHLDTRRCERITPDLSEPVAYSGGRFSLDDAALYVTTDKDAEFHRLTRLDLATKRHQPWTTHIPWDVSEFDLSPDGRTIAFITNEDGIGVLHLLSTRTGRERPAPKLPLGIPSGLEWHQNSRDLAFNLSSAKSPADAYSVDVKTSKFERWTESETGGLDASRFVEPRLVRLESFDGLPISAFIYQPDPARFPGRRPVLINIHGGPEAQSRPGFQARNNYFLDQLGVAIAYPNVRGSDGYGKTFLTLDNGFKREDSVKDIGAIIGWLRAQPEFDPDRLAVVGGSYGGYMALASMIHFGDRLRCGVDFVGISNFLTFLRNTQDYRRDLRRVEYGDERDPAMAAFLDRISPLTQANRLTKPLLVVQGKNDPRVPLSEAEQMVRAARANGHTIWYLMAKDEGHGFVKKKNSDFMFLTTIQFFQEHLLGNR